MGWGCGCRGRGRWVKGWGSPSPAQACTQEDGDPFPPGPHPTGLSASWPHGGGAVPPGGLPDPGSHPDLSPDLRRGISRSNRETRGIGSPVVRMETALGLFLCQDAPRSGRPGAPESRLGNGAEEGLPGSQLSLGGLRARPCRGPGHLLPQAWSLSPHPWLPALTLLLHRHSSLTPRNMMDVPEMPPFSSSFQAQFHEEGGRLVTTLITAHHHSQLGEPPVQSRQAWSKWEQAGAQGWGSGATGGVDVRSSVRHGRITASPLKGKCEGDL